jgi:hypothetical protein
MEARDLQELRSDLHDLYDAIGGLGIEAEALNMSVRALTGSGPCPCSAPSRSPNPLEGPCVLCVRVHSCACTRSPQYPTERGSALEACPVRGCGGALFTRVRGIGILRTSPFGHSAKLDE